MDDKEVKLGALLLSALMLTRDGDLPRLRKQRIGRESTLELIHLLRVREMLHELFAAIEADDEQRWQRVHDAWKALYGTRRDDGRIVDERGVVTGTGPESTVDPPAADDGAGGVEPQRPHEPTDAGAEQEAPVAAAAEAHGPPRPGLIPAPALPLPDFSAAVPERAPDLLEVEAGGVSPWVQDAERGRDGGDRAPAPPAVLRAPSALDPVAMPPAPAPAPPAEPAPLAAELPPAAAEATIGLATGGRPRGLGTTLPFSGQRVAPAPLDTEPSRRPTGTLDAPHEPRDPSTLPFVGQGSQPVVADEAQADLPHAPTEPAGTRADPTASLGVAGYAALCAISDVVPEAAVISRTVYGVGGDRGLQELEQAWQQRFADAPELRELYDALHRQFRGWLERHARR